jgi:hypothetical protein
MGLRAGGVSSPPRQRWLSRHARDVPAHASTNPQRGHVGGIVNADLASDGDRSGSPLAAIRAIVS